jgi:hypothetical protein
LIPIRIRELKIEAGRMNFSDYSVPPDFNAVIQDLKGTVEALSSARDSRAKVDLSGNLGEFSPVTISGELQPFQFDHSPTSALTSRTSRCRSSTLFRKVRGLQHRQRQAQHTAPLPGPGPQARRQAQDPHRAA